MEDKSFMYGGAAPMDIGGVQEDPLQVNDDWQRAVDAQKSVPPTPAHI